jgi:hypothetical protein
MVHFAGTVVAGYFPKKPSLQFAAGGDEHISYAERMVLPLDISAAEASLARPFQWAVSRNTDHSVHCICLSFALFDEVLLA